MRSVGSRAVLVSVQGVTHQSGAWSSGATGMNVRSRCLWHPILLCIDLTARLPGYHLPGYHLPYSPHHLTASSDPSSWISLCVSYMEYAELFDYFYIVNCIYL